MGGIAQQITQTVDTGDRTNNFSPALTNNQTYYTYDTAGTEAFSSLPTNGAFLTQLRVDVGPVKSRSPSLANSPTYDAAVTGADTINFDPPVITTSAKTATWTGSRGERYRFSDTFYTLSSATHGPNTLQMTAYLDDPAEGAEGAEMMAMLAGGF